MTSKFERKMESYVVLNNKDVQKYLNESQRSHLNNIIGSIRKGRISNNKPLRDAVVVTDKYPEFYDIVWKLLEKEISYNEKLPPSEDPSVLTDGTLEMIRDMINRMSVKIMDRSGKAGFGSTISNAATRTNIVNIINYPRYLESAYAQVMKNNPKMSVADAVDESIKLILKMYFNSYSYRVTADIVRYRDEYTPIHIDLLINECNHPPTYSFVRTLDWGEFNPKDTPLNEQSILIKIMDKGICKTRKLMLKSFNEFNENPLQMGDPVFVSSLAGE